MLVLLLSSTDSCLNGRTIDVAASSLLTSFRRLLIEDEHWSASEAGRFLKIDGRLGLLMDELTPPGTAAVVTDTDAVAERVFIEADGIDTESGSGAVGGLIGVFKLWVITFSINLFVCSAAVVNLPPTPDIMPSFVLTIRGVTGEGTSTGVTVRPPLVSIVGGIPTDIVGAGAVEVADGYTLEALLAVTDITPLCALGVE